MILRLVSAVVLLSALFGPRAVLAEDAKDKLHAIESQLSQQKEQAASLDQKAKEASDDLKDLREKLIAAAAALDAKQEEQERLQDKLDELAEDTDAKNAAFTDERKSLGALSAVLIELSRQPIESLFLQSDFTVDHIHQMILLRAVLPRVRDQIDVTARDLVALEDLKAQMAEQKRLTEAAQVNLEEQRRNLDQLVRARQGLLQQTETQKQAIARQLISLSSEAKDLHQLLEKVSPNHATHVHAFSGLSSALKPPVAGHIIHPFGARDVDGVRSEGVTFAGLPGAPVVAPRAGRVVFEGPFKGYGQIVILQHDGGYHSFLAGFGRIDADMGEEVEAGEPLGVLPVKSGARPELYFEWRHENEPVDPTGIGSRE